MLGQLNLELNLFGKNGEENQKRSSLLVDFGSCLQWKYSFIACFNHFMTVTVKYGYAIHDDMIPFCICCFFINIYLYMVVYMFRFEGTLNDALRYF